MEADNKKTWKKKPEVIKKKGIWIGTAAIILLAVIAGCIYFFRVKNAGSKMEKMPQEVNSFGGGTITASGLTSMGMTEESYKLDFLETLLFIEESYLSVGDTVEAGTAVFKVSDETLHTARKEVERAVTETTLAYRQGVIDDTVNRLNEKSSYDKAQINKEYALAEYDYSLKQAKENLDDLRNQIEEAEKIYEEYTASVENDYYYTYYRVQELKDIYYDNFSFLMDLYDIWDMEGLYDQYPNGGMNSIGSGSIGTTGTSGGNGDSTAAGEAAFGSGMESKMAAGMPSGGSTGAKAQESSSDDSSKITVYEMMEELVTKNGEEYETAVDNYEKDTLMAEASLEIARSNLATLQADLAEAELEYEKQVITGKAAYDTTMTESENARSVYETAIQKLDEELESLKDSKEEAEKNLQVFEEVIGDGFFYTKDAGTIVMNLVRENSYLSAEDLILAYSNPETVTVEASVLQADIAKIAIGDSVYAVINGYGNYEGIVKSVDPVSSSESRSSVTYTVTVDLSGDITGLASNLSAYVYFGLTEEQLEQIKEVNNRSGGKPSEEQKVS